ncbi:hypothetical protein N0O92_10795 [Alkalihalobacillus sp. MEB130]|nr:hypothetical protein [Alkalihalobacillus sp. MEB130]MDT8860722.1 hypothetical protein [Alkalihalobacillus sp. MEB130]
MEFKEYVKKILAPLDNEQEIELLDVEPAFQFSLEDWRGVDE